MRGAYVTCAMSETMGLDGGHRGGEGFRVGDDGDGCEGLEP